MKKDHGWQQVEGVLFVPEDDKANPPQATMTMYGSAVGIEYVAVAIHRGSDLIAGVFIDVEDCQTEEQMTNYLVAFTKKYNVDKMFILEQVLAPEYDQYGHRLLRIADGKGTLLPGSYSVIDTN